MQLQFLLSKKIFWYTLMRYNYRRSVLVILMVSSTRIRSTRVHLEGELSLYRMWMQSNRSHSVYVEKQAVL